MKPNRPNYGTYRFPRPSLAQRIDELAQRDPFLTGFMAGAILTGMPLLFVIAYLLA
jgi:hypothetical protein